jgi:uncharacterized membrane protein YhaH (DUF805 family)
MEWYLKVLKNYAGFGGRSRRKEYWMFTLFSLIVSVILAILGGILNMPMLGNIYSLLVLIPSIAVGIRRMHDTNHSGWFILVPFYNLYLACINGDAGENQYGPDPKGGSSFNNDALDSHLTN